MKFCIRNILIVGSATLALGIGFMALPSIAGTRGNGHGVGGHVGGHAGRDHRGTHEDFQGFPEYVGLARGGNWYGYHCGQIPTGAGICGY
jgi:hypothetical protein